MKRLYTKHLLSISKNKRISVHRYTNIFFNQSYDVFTTLSITQADNKFEDKINSMLYKRGIDVIELSKSPLFNFVDEHNVWLSKKINNRKSKINYIGGIMVKYNETSAGEKILDEAALLDSIKQYFEMLNMAILSGEKIETVAIPLITTHIKGISNDVILFSFIRECINFLKINRKIKEVIIIEKEVRRFIKKLNDLYLLEYYNNEIKSYEEPLVYISYDIKDINMMHKLSNNLKENNFSVCCTDYDSNEKYSKFNLYKCMCFIAIVSQNSIISHRVLNEIELAIKTHRNQIPLILLKVDAVKITPVINCYLKYCKFLDIKGLPISKWFSRLIENLDYNDKLNRIKNNNLNKEMDLFDGYKLSHYEMKNQNEDIALPNCSMMIRSEKQNDDSNQQTNSNDYCNSFSDAYAYEKFKYYNKCETKLQIAKNNKSIRLTEVQFAAVIPEKYQSEKYLTIDIFMYEEIYKKIVEEKVANSSENVRIISSGIQEINYNTMVRIELKSPDIEFLEEEKQKWIGKFSIFTFCINIPRDIDKEEILFIASIYFNDIIATKLKFIVKKDANNNGRLNIERKDIMSGFISYASQDRATVTKIIQGMKSARPDLDIFFDVESLRSGDKWEEKIKNEIEKRDTLYLCWSKYAKESEYVTMEWNHALIKKGIDSIEPIPLVSPNECPPPEELKSKHFNDKILYFR